MSGLFRVGDRVIVGDRVDWPDPPGYPFAGAEGTVAEWVHFTDALEGFSEYVFVRVERAQETATPYLGGVHCFSGDELIRVVSASEASF